MGGKCRLDDGNNAFDESIFIFINEKEKKNEFK
jgi:hypothetical protein